MLQRLDLLVICAYAFLSFFSPSEAFLYSYFQHDKRFSAETLVSRIYPLWTYALLASLLLLMVCMTKVSSKWVIVVGGIARVTSGAIVILVPPGMVPLMQLDMLCFGFFFAVKTVVLPVFVLELSQADMFQKSVALIRSSVLMGCGVSAVIGQVAASAGATVPSLAWITLVAHAVALACACTFPATAATSESRFNGAALCALISARSGIWWILLWITGTAATQELVLTYYQAIFREALQPSENHFNAAVLFVAYVAGTCTSMLLTSPVVEKRIRHWVALLAPATCALGSSSLYFLGSCADTHQSMSDLSIYGAFILAHANFEFVRTFCVAQLGVLMVEQGCRQFLPVLMVKQFGISIMQMLLQAGLQAISKQVGKQALALAAFLAILGVILGVAAATMQFCGRGAREYDSSRICSPPHQTVEFAEFGDGCGQSLLPLTGDLTLQCLVAPKICVR